MTRFHWLPIAALLLSAPSLAQAAPPVDQVAALPTQVGYYQVSAGYTRPVHVTHAGDGSDRLFVVEQGGQIRIIQLADGGAVTTPFLDISSRVKTNAAEASEEGLLSVAFAPDYETSGRFYVYYTNLAGDNVVARYHVSADPNVADATSEQIVLTIGHPVNTNHNGGQLQFGSDGMLYIGTGDGGGVGDPFQAAQNLNDLRGKILRIDVETGSPTTYVVPADNPYAVDGNAATRGEIWHLGLRNPWRFSFDRQTHDLFIGDVGQEAVEEIDFLAAGGSGANFGWSCYEGNSVYAAANCSQPITHTVPIFTVAHPTAESITGGYVYRGTDVPAWQGVYFFGDYVTGRMWVLENTGAWTSAELPQTTFGVSSFGEDESGELYVLDYQFEGSNSAVYRLGDPAQLTLRLYLANVSK